MRVRTTLSPRSAVRARAGARAKCTDRPGQFRPINGWAARNTNTGRRRKKTRKTTKRKARNPTAPLSCRPIPTARSAARRPHHAETGQRERIDARPRLPSGSCPGCDLSNSHHSAEPGPLPLLRPAGERCDRRPSKTASVRAISNRARDGALRRLRSRFLRSQNARSVPRASSPCSGLSSPT